MFIDAHTHGMHAERDAQGRLRPPLVTCWRSEYGSPQELVRQHNERGLEKVVVLDPAEVAFELKDMFGDFVVPAPMVNMERTTAEDIDRLLSRGAPAIKFIAPMHSYGDNRYFPLYEVIRDRRALAIFHTGYLSGGLHEPGGVLSTDDHVDITHMRPAALDRIARAFGDLKILMAHFGNPWWEEAWTVLKSNRNIYAELSGGTAMYKSMDMWRTLFRPNGNLHVASVKKLCFGTDVTPFLPDRFDYLAAFEFHERFCDALGVPEEIRARIARENIVELLRSV